MKQDWPCIEWVIIIQALLYYYLHIYFVCEIFHNDNFLKVQSLYFFPIMLVKVLLILLIFSNKQLLLY